LEVMYLWPRYRQHILVATSLAFLLYAYLVIRSEVNANDNDYMLPATRVAAVTGANKGIGLAIVRQLALQYPRSPFSGNGSIPLLIYLTARNESRGQQALKDIRADPKLEDAKALQEDGGLTSVQYLPLDIDSEKSIDDFASKIKISHPEGIDFLINNAGMAMDGFDANVVKKTLHCNYYGTMQTMRLLLPHIRDGGRLVNVASTTGHLTSKYSGTIKQRFLNSKTHSDVTALMEDFANAVGSNSYQGDWPNTAYAVSKAGVIGMTRAIAIENAKSGSKILINSCCPGYVNTDMTKGRGPRTPDQGAETPVMLAIADIKGANGEFWKNRKAIEW
jgi:carbonyl reductase 1